MFRTFLAACMLFSSATAALAAAPEGATVLERARTVSARTYQGFTYGEDFKDRKVNCVQFIGSVIEDWLGRKLTKEEESLIYIRYNFTNLEQAILANEPRTKGIAEAIPSILKIGTSINVEDTKPGDFIQYWIRKKDGGWMGHSAIIENVWRDSSGGVRASLYGAHQSTNGISSTSFQNGQGLALGGANRRIHIARIQSPPAAAK